MFLCITCFSLAYVFNNKRIIRNEDSKMLCVNFRLVGFTLRMLNNTDVQPAQLNNGIENDVFYMSLSLTQYSTYYLCEREENR